MNRLRIAVADDEQDMRDFFERMLPLCGHEVVSIAETGKQLVEHCHALKPDVVIADIKMPDMDGIDAAQQLCREHPTPIILVSAHHAPEFIERADMAYVMGYLVKPIGQADLAPAIAVAVRRFQEMQEMRKETADLKQALADRKVIEQAKGILMKSTGADEKDAFHRLQLLASDKNQKLIEAALSVIAVEKAFRPAEPTTARGRNS
jgi:two-component system, response regulator PdtaR